jgi:hypothetical protein
VLCKLLDRFDREQRFTVGYHVTAVRRHGDAAGAPRSPEV